ncbi:MAG: PA0069 family radical SAM protein [Croceitalea sp.]|nr:PA0069 family radical SAM protein [Croceitalea sp.]
MKQQNLLKGRGAQENSHNRFLSDVHEMRDDFLEYCRVEGEAVDKNTTEYLPVFPKTIINKVNSPDVPFSYSLNPYQGCEHGCVYCYARNAHEYWGYSAGLDFERKILIKAAAPELLAAKISHKNWKAQTIVMSGNTDCYQPAERKFELTRQCLKVFLKFRHPVGIITKNALILRDVDLLRELAELGLVAVNVSVTTLSEDTRRLLEPRTTTIKKRLQTIKVLSENKIPVNAMLAPIIPGINSHELLPLAKAVADHGALSFGHTVVRLNGAIGQLFTSWIQKALPDSAEKVLNQIKDCHGGTLKHSRFGLRNKGEGHIAKQIHDMAQMAKRNYFSQVDFPTLRTDMHAAFKTGQMRLF